jgi:hypothetical protein
MESDQNKIIFQIGAGENRKLEPPTSLLLEVWEGVVRETEGLIGFTFVTWLSLPSV